MDEGGFDKELLLRLIAGVSEGDLDEAGRVTLNALLASSTTARRFYRAHMDLHARLHLDYGGARLPADMPGATPRSTARRFPTGWLVMAATAAACIAILATVSGTRPAAAPTFAAVAQVRAARWAGGDLPTAEGARLGRGTLRLAEGLATLSFDSGAVVTLEGPAELRLGDAMHCVLAAGTAVADVPDSAIGFRISTPAAHVVDFGTRFCVSVDAATGGTKTQVYEGRVEVTHRDSGGIVSLETGQEISTAAGAGDGAPGSVEPPLLGPPAYGPDWVAFETTQDAYIGRFRMEGVEVHGSETLLLVKNGDAHRKAYLGFDLTAIDANRIAEANLTLQFAPTGWGVAAVVPDATFSVYGLISDLPWDERSLNDHNAPASTWSRPQPPKPATGGAWLDPTKVRRLGSFVIEQGVQTGSFGIGGPALVTFLREHAGAMITLIVTRDTAERETNGLVHGFASRRHPTLRPPTMVIRLREPGAAEITEAGDDGRKP